MCSNFNKFQITKAQNMLALRVGILNMIGIQLVYYKM